MSYVIFGREYPESYDAIVIGAGIGGLVCSNLLVRGGMKVLLLERHYMLGGYCSTFRRKGFLFDAATHFYPLLGNPTTRTGRLIQELGVPTEWVRMDPVDQFHLPGLPTFAVPADYDQYIRLLKDWFPEETRAIDAYFAELRAAEMYGLLYYFRGIETEQARRFEAYTITQKLDEHFRDPRLKTLLMADTPHWGSLPSRTSYLFDALLRLSYFLGNYYPRGSSQKFADDLGRALETQGSKVLRCASADRILIEKGRVGGVEISTISKAASEKFVFRAPVVVSNADALHTYRQLIGEDVCGRELIERLEARTPSHPCFLMHLGLRGMDPAVLDAAAGYYWSCYDPNDVVRNVFKVFVPTQYDPSIAPPGCQIVIIQKVTPARIGEVQDWGIHKQQTEDQVMGRLREILPGIDQHIVVKLSASALTSFRFTNNWHGAMLGWEMSPEQLGAARLSVSSPAQNLHFVGHWAQPGGGITPVIVSAQQAARKILTGRTFEDEGPFSPVSSGTGAMARGV